MSHEIEYRLRAFKEELTHDSGTRYVLIIEGGSSNVFTSDATGRPQAVREWFVGMIGTEDQVLRQAVRRGAACEGGMLRLCGRNTTPEAYIARARAAIRRAEPGLRQHLGLTTMVGQDHQLVGAALEAGFEVKRFDRYGEPLAEVWPPATAEDRLEQFFAVVAPFLDRGEVRPHRVGPVYGLASS